MISVRYFTIAVLATAPLTAQTAPISGTCAAASCEAGAIYVVAIESLLARPGGSSEAPRVLSQVYLAPFKPLNTGRPAPVADFNLVSMGLIRRRWPNASIVDSAAIVGTGGQLQPGGSLFVVSPIDWMGKDDARLEIARYPKDWNWGEQFFVWVHRGAAGWDVARIEVGWQN